MPRPRKPFPTPRRHKGAAVLDLYRDGRRRTVTLGPWGSERATQEYARLLAEAQASPGPVVAGPDATVNEVLLAFLDYAEGHYRRADGTQTNEVAQFRQTFRVVRELYGHTPAREFGPRALKVVRDRMIALGWSRKEINKRVGRVGRAFRWAASEELVPAAVPQTLGTVAGLREGRSAAKELPPVEPVAVEHVAATLPHLGPIVRAMVEVQLLTGVRPEEVCRLRPCDLDARGAVWLYRPPQHKKRHLEKGRVVAVGPRAQAVLARFTPADPTGYYFSPRRAAEEFRAARAAARKTPRYPSHMKRNAAKRVANPRRAPGARYPVTSYEHAITRAIDRANRERARTAAAASREPGDVVPHWHPNQLRHTRATEVRAEYGLEAAQVVLGHERADVTQVYAEKNLALAVRVAAESG